jgi:hypothetical protein
MTDHSQKQAQLVGSVVRDENMCQADAVVADKDRGLAGLLPIVRVPPRRYIASSFDRRHLVYVP